MYSGKSTKVFVFYAQPCLDITFAMNVSNLSLVVIALVVWVVKCVLRVCSTGRKFGLEA